MKTVIVFLLLLLSNVMVFAQNKMSNKITSQAFPNATFEASFEKLFSENPLFSWRADMGVNFIGYRKGPHDLTGKVTFFTAGTQPSRGRINIAGIAYGLEGCYKYQWVETNWLSVCDSHLSSHRTEELSGLEKRVIKKGKSLSSISAVDLNIISFTSGFVLKLPTWPRFVLRFQPIRFGYGGGVEFYDQPVYFASRFMLIGNNNKKLSFITTHEFGKSSFNDVYLSLDLFTHNQEEGRVQLYAGYSPNRQTQLSINEGIRRGGFKTGVRLLWDAN